MPSASALTRLDGAERVWILTAAIGAVGLGLYFLFARHLPAGSAAFEIPWWALAAMFYVVEIGVVHLHFRRDAHSFTLSEIPLVLGVLFARPGALLLAGLIGAAIALTVNRRQRPVKLAFNLALFCLEATVAVAIFHAVTGPGDPFALLTTAVVFLATSGAAVVGVTTVFIAISLSEGGPELQNLPQAFALGLVVAVTNTSVALAGGAILARDLALGWLLFAPAAVVFLAYRAYVSERQRRNSLEFLYETTRIVHRAKETESAILALLSQARTMFRAETAEIVLIPATGEEVALRTTLGPGNRVEQMKPVAVTSVAWLKTPRACILGDSMVAPLEGETRPVGMMVVANRLGDVSSFDSNDLRLFETLAAHAGLSLENGRLEQSLTRVLELDEQLRESEERYRILAEQLPLITYINDLDETGSALYISPQIEATLGYSQEEWLEDPDLPQRLLHPRDRDRVLADAARSLAAQGRWGSEYRILAKGGRTVWLRNEAVLVRDYAGQPRYVQGYLLDITAEKEADQARVELEEELRQAQKLEAVGRLAGGVAHDFNNLLTVIIGYSETLLGRLAEKGSEAHLREIKKAAERAASLTRQLLAFSRKQMLQPAVLDLNLVALDMQKMISPLIGENIELITDFAPDLGRVEVDRGQLEQVIVNLAVNARDAMPYGGTLTIGTANVDGSLATRHAARQLGTCVELRVSDNGSGMDAETRSRIFEPFFTTKGQGKGTGIGLATVHGIVEQSGGHILVESAVGEGTTFRIYLPRIEDAVESLELADAGPGAPPGSEVVLVVEDEAAVRNLVCGILEMNGYTVLAAASGEEALELCERRDEPIRLLLTDVVMAGMSGQELAERLLAQRPEIDVLYMTGYAPDHVVRNGVPGIAILQKPFKSQALCSKVREVLDRAGTSGDPTPARVRPGWAPAAEHRAA